MRPSSKTRGKISPRFSTSRDTCKLVANGRPSSLTERPTLDLSPGPLRIMERVAVIARGQGVATCASFLGLRRRPPPEVARRPSSVVRPSQYTGVRLSRHQSISRPISLKGEVRLVSCPTFAVRPRTTERPVSTSYTCDRLSLTTLMRRAST